MKPEMLSLLPLALALTGRAQPTSVPAGVSATAEARVRLSRQQSFLHVVPIPLEKIFRAGKGIPAITGTSVVTPWDAVGQSRQVFFATGDSAREEITHYEPGRYFAYRVSHFTLAAKYVAKYAVGEWWWSEENGQTTIVWRYTFVPRNFLTRPLLAFFVRTRWRPYMEAAMRRVQQDADSPSADPGRPAR